MQPISNGQQYPLTDLSFVPTISKVSPKEDQDLNFIVSVDKSPEMFLVGKGSWISPCSNINEAIQLLAELTIDQHPAQALSEAIIGTLTDSDKVKVLELLQGPAKKTTEQPSLVSDNELIAALENEFQNVTWPADKLSVASDAQMKEYLDRRIAIQRKQPNPTAIQQKARQIKNAIYYELKYGTAIKQATKPALVTMKPRRKRKAA